MKEYFGKEGRLKDVLDGYEPRQEQLQMAEHVYRAFSSGQHLIVEAGTGVGKSLAYLVPLAHQLIEGHLERAVVSTYTKALQRQLVEKDIPLIHDRLFPELRYALCFGSENYLCLRRLENLRTQGLFEPLEREEIDRILRWVEQTETGLYMEVTPHQSLWFKVCRESDLCHGRDCRYYSRCFYQRARAEQKRAHLLVVNHHLFFANLASGWNVLPPFDGVVFDEAHEIEDVATDYLGVEFSNTGLKYLLDSLLSERNRGLLTRLGLKEERLKEYAQIINRIREQGNRFFGSIYEWLGGERSKRIEEEGLFLDILSEHLDTLKEALEDLKEHCDDETLKDLLAYIMRITATKEAVGALTEQSLPEHVYWAEMEKKKIRLVASPIEPADMLEEMLFNALDTVVLTSATLSVKRSFHYLKERLGIGEADELILSSPFNYRENMVLYIPTNVPDPSEPDYVDEVIREIEKLLNITGGQTLVLFTSYAMMNAVREGVNCPGLTLYCQGDFDSFSLVNQFRKNPRSALFGTYTFWQGIDLPGEQLRCVIITKLPFSVPTEPVVQARIESLTKRGVDAFTNYQLPRAIITFKQGFGRLIRSSTDKGVVALLDSRVLRRGYGRAFIESLPDVRITHQREDVLWQLTGKM